MIKSIAPTRLSLLGGGTDIDSFSKKYGGIVLSMAINIRQELKVDLGEESKSLLPTGSSLEFFKKIASEMGVKEYGLCQTFDGEITGGLGSSASAAVAMVGAIDKYQNLGMTRSEIAEKAWDIEVNKAGMFGGKQDQYAAAYGGVNVFQFGDEVEVVSLNNEFVKELMPHIVMFYTGKNRKLPNVQNGLREPGLDQIHALQAIKQFTTDGIEMLAKKDIEGFARIVDLAWMAKKKSNKVSTPEVDKLYAKAMKLGAWSGKLMGSGGGGYMFFLTEHRQKLIDGLGIPQIDFSIDWNGLDCRKI